MNLSAARPLRVAIAELHPVNQSYVIEICLLQVGVLTSRLGNDCQVLCWQHHMLRKPGTLIEQLCCKSCLCCPSMQTLFCSDVDISTGRQEVIASSLICVANVLERVPSLLCRSIAYRQRA